MSNVKAQSPKEYGIVEEWNIGVMGIFRNKFPLVLSLFHHSSIPLFQTFCILTFI
jgi:hypothetical protein